MTIATWRGTGPGSWLRSFTGGPRGPCSAAALVPSDGQDLGFLGRGQAVDLADRPVGEPLQLVERAALLVLGDLLVLGQALGMVVGVAPEVTDRDLRLLRGMADDLGQFLPPLLGQRRHRHPEQVALRCR